MILLTGFNPSGKLKSDPSGEIASLLDGSIFRGNEIKGICLDLAYDSVNEFCLNSRTGQYDYIINLGLDIGKPSILLEKGAIIRSDDNSLDFWNIPKPKQSPFEIFTSLDIEGILNSLRSARIPARIAPNHDSSLINRLYYSSLVLSDGRALLVGLPATPEISVKGDVPVLDLESMIRAVELTVQKII